MCGVAGYFTVPGATLPHDILDRFQAALNHRGPDGTGRFSEGPVGLAHTRLAIIDPEGGDQPILSNGRALVANGEIYNDPDVRRRFSAASYQTGSDCESILHLYAHGGLPALRELRGMAAFALYDPVPSDGGSTRLILWRDPFGIKPLYYAETETGVFFASEPAALVQAGVVEAALHAPAASDLLQFQFTPGAATAFEGIFRVLPGETLIVEDGRITKREQQQGLPDSAPHRLSKEDALLQLDSIFEESVRIHQRSDVPFGMFLSGGLDSSAVLAMMARLNPHPVLAYTIGFPGMDVHDERAHAAEVARAAGARHVPVDFTEADFWRLLPEVAAAMDDPVADYACLPTYLLARKAAREVKVVLSGEGGDELFAGYGRYRTARRPRPFCRPMRRHGNLEGTGILRSPENWRENYETRRPSRTEGWTRLQHLQAEDCADWLPHDLLIKLDRCLMRHGVEGRVPMLDPRVAELAFCLPDSLKIRHRRGKWLLRRWLARSFPVSRPFTRKRGFTVPVEAWIRAHGEALAPRVAAQPGIAHLCHPHVVESAFRGEVGNARKALWPLLFFALWHEIHIQGTPPGESVFETLGGSA